MYHFNVRRNKILKQECADKSLHVAISGCFHVEQTCAEELGLRGKQALVHSSLTLTAV